MHLTLAYNTQVNCYNLLNLDMFELLMSILMKFPCLMNLIILHNLALFKLKSKKLS